MVWMGLQKMKKIGHEMALSRAILGQILAILRISDQKNDQPFFGGKSYLLPGKLFVRPKNWHTSSLQWF